MAISERNHIKRVALAGASGNLGKEVLSALVRSQKFDVTVLVHAASKPISIPAEVRILTIDYDSEDSLRAALQGIDAVVSTLGKVNGLQCQFKLIDAAAAVGVKRFLPSEFGADLQDPTARSFPVYRTKVQLETYLEKIAAQTGLTYTYIYTSVLLEEGLASKAFVDFAARKVGIFDGGEHPFSAARWATAAKAVVGILENPDATENRAVRVQDLTMTSNELLSLLQRLDPEQSWVPAPVNTEQLVEDAKADLASGKFSPSAFAAFALRGTFALGLGGTYNADNELLGIKEMTEEEFGDILKARIAAV